MNVNQVTFGGKVGFDPDVKETKGGKRMVSLSVGYCQKVDDGYRWTNMRVKCFGYSADDAAQVRKGDNVVVSGKLETSEYTDKQGNKRTSTDIVAFSIGVVQSRDKQEKRDPGGYDVNPDHDDIPF